MRSLPKEGHGLRRHSGAGQEPAAESRPGFPGSPAQPTNEWRALRGRSLAQKPRRHRLRRTAARPRPPLPASAPCPAGTSQGRLPLAPACCPARRGWMALGAPLLLLLLLPPMPGLAEPEATMEGQGLPVHSLQEAESRAFTCLASAPSLAWYLNGERQGESNDSSKLMSTGNGTAFEGSSSTFVVTSRRLHRQLNCSATNPLTGLVSSASVLLNVQFKPEIVKVDTQYEEGSKEPGLLLVLFVLVRANPPASITWVDQDGQVMVNTSSFLIVDTKTYPWLTNHTLQLHLSSLAQNISYSAANDVGVANSSGLLPGFLDTSIELPLLALVVGGVAALGTLLCLGALISRVVYWKGKAAAGLLLPAQLPLSSSNNLKPTGVRLPRANRSLPANLQLNDLAPEAGGKEGGTAAAQGGEVLSEPEDSLALAHRGLGRVPMVGYIYRASSTSSDEIWL